MQLPVQAPAWQAWLVHGTGVPYVPFAAHVATPLPLQLFVPGTHDPVQLPFTQAALVQGTPVPHLPLLSQVWTPFFVSHWVAFGVQVPAHAPLTHA